MSNPTEDMWRGIRAETRNQLATRNYSSGAPAERLASTGISASEVISMREQLAEGWIPGVEVFPRRVFQQKGRGYFSELTRLSEGVMKEIGLVPQQWATALVHREGAKGFHIHPPFVPEGRDAEEWFHELYVKSPDACDLRRYDCEQWDVMFFLTGICEMILVDERAGMPRRIMRFSIDGDSRPGPDNAAAVIPPGVAHAIRNVGNEDLIMVYGTSTVFNPSWEGRIASEVEECRLPEDWKGLLECADSSGESS